MSLRNEKLGVESQNVGYSEWVSIISWFGEAWHIVMVWVAQLHEWSVVERHWNKLDSITWLFSWWLHYKLSYTFTFLHLIFRLIHLRFNWTPFISQMRLTWSGTAAAAVAASRTRMIIAMAASVQYHRPSFRSRGSYDPLPGRPKLQSILSGWTATRRFIAHGPFPSGADLPASVA